MAEAQGSSDELGVVEAAGSGKTSAMTRSTSAGSPVQAATRSLWSREAWDAPTQETASRDFKFTQPPISRGSCLLSTLASTATDNLAPTTLPISPPRATSRQPSVIVIFTLERLIHRSGSPGGFCASDGRIHDCCGRLPCLLRASTPSPCRAASSPPVSVAVLQGSAADHSPWLNLSRRSPRGPFRRRNTVLRQPAHSRVSRCHRTRGLEPMVAQLRSQAPRMPFRLMLLVRALQEVRL